MLSPHFSPLAQIFNSEFRGLTLVPVTVEDLEEARRRLVFELYGMLTDRQGVSALGKARRWKLEVVRPSGRREVARNSMEAPEPRA